jgi:hypothetical protein
MNTSISSRCADVAASINGLSIIGYVVCFVMGAIAGAIVYAWARDRLEQWMYAPITEYANKGWPE